MYEPVEWDEEGKPTKYKYVWEYRSKYTPHEGRKMREKRKRQRARLLRRRKEE